MLGLIGRKVGMTRVFDENENLVAVTVVEAGPCPVVQVKSPEKDGYAALKVGFGETKPHRVSRPARGETEKAGAGPLSHLREFRVEGDPGHDVGDVLRVEIFEPGERVNVSGRTKGRGFAGNVKRHGFKGGPKTHGQSDRWRSPGSIGQSSDPSRVFKGLRMAGHMGDRNVTVRGVRVFGVDKDRNLLLLKGAVPGGPGTPLVIRKRT